MGFLDSLEDYEVKVLAADAELRSRDLLEAMVKPYGVESVNVHLAVGHIASALAEVVRSQGAGLLVVGTGARGRIGTFLLGNSAELILASAPCDVLAVHIWVDGQAMSLSPAMEDLAARRGSTVRLVDIAETLLGFPWNPSGRGDTDTAFRIGFEYESPLPYALLEQGVRRQALFLAG